MSFYAGDLVEHVTGQGFIHHFLVVLQGLVVL